MSKNEYNVTKEMIADFLIYSAQHGYGNDNRVEKKEPDSSSTIEVSEDNFKMSDNYFGGEPYGGRTVISYEGHPTWIMVYYGGVASNILGIDTIYPYLKEQLLNPEGQMPVRGPLSNKKDKFEYKLSVDGDLKEFSGIEEIFYEGELVFKTFIAGGLVDQKK